MRELEEAKLVAVVRAASADDAVAVSDALIEGGVRAIEVAFTTPDAPAAISALAGRVAVGAGTVTTRAEASAAIDAGAAFVVSPGYQEEVVDAVLEAGRTVLPGVLTPTEIMRVRRRGLDAMKLFPGSLVGPGYLRGLLGPFPEVRLMPTGGVSIENVGGWLEAGAFAVGVGGGLAPPRLRDDGHRDGVVEAARRFVAAVEVTA